MMQPASLLVPPQVASPIPDPGPGTSWLPSRPAASGLDMLNAATAPPKPQVATNDRNKGETAHGAGDTGRGRVAHNFDLDDDFCPCIRQALESSSSSSTAAAVPTTNADAPGPSVHKAKSVLGRCSLSHIIMHHPNGFARLCSAFPDLPRKLASKHPSPLNKLMDAVWPWAAPLPLRERADLGFHAIQSWIPGVGSAIGQGKSSDGAMKSLILHMLVILAEEPVGLSSLVTDRIAKLGLPSLDSLGGKRADIEVLEPGQLPAALESYQPMYKIAQAYADEVKSLTQLKLDTFSPMTVLVKLGIPHPHISVTHVSRASWVASAVASGGAECRGSGASILDARAAVMYHHIVLAVKGLVPSLWGELVAGTTTVKKCQSVVAINTNVVEPVKPPFPSFKYISWFRKRRALERRLVQQRYARARPCPPHLRIQRSYTATRYGMPYRRPVTLAVPRRPMVDERRRRQPRVLDRYVHKTLGHLAPVPSRASRQSATQKSRAPVKAHAQAKVASFADVFVGVAIAVESA